MSTYVHFIPATGEIIGWLSDEEEVIGNGYLLNESDIPAESRKQYVANGILCEYTAAELAEHDGLQPGWIWQMPARVAVDMRSLDVAKAQTWERIKLSRDAAEAGNFTCAGSVYQTDLARIPGAALLALLAQMSGAAFSEDWTLFDNTVRTLDAAGMIAVGVAQGAHIKSTFAIGDGLRVQIAAATTNAQLDLIGWPA